MVKVVQLVVVVRHGVETCWAQLTGPLGLRRLGLGAVEAVFGRGAVMTVAVAVLGVVREARVVHMLVLRHATEVHVVLRGEVLVRTPVMHRDGVYRIVMAN